MGVQVPPFLPGDRLVPYAFAQYDAQVSKENAEETFGDWECNNGFQLKYRF